MRAFVLLAAFISSPCLAQDQIKLRCAGEQTSESAAGSEVRPYEKIYRIDLADNRWCEDACRAMHDIAEVHPVQITLEEKQTDSPSEQTLTRNFINRETGRHSILSTARYFGPVSLTVMLKWEGHCEPEPFDEFPEVQTKF
ncbi:MAG: hypothetical protein AAFZ11_00775 [Pseudomonadota bacterium]